MRIKLHRRKKRDIILPRKGESMAKEKWTDAHAKWQRENKKSYTMRCSRVSEQPMIDWMSDKVPYQAYIKKLVKADMDTDKAWAICMGVRIGAEYARVYKWAKLGEQLVELANELGQKLGLAPDDVFREAHQVMERERL